MSENKEVMVVGGAGAEPTQNGRRKNGTFAKGNPGGPGNTFAARSHKFKHAIMAAVTEKEINRVIRALIRKASDGDVAAAKELLDRILGKPTTVIEGDLNLTSDSTLADRLQRATDRVVQLQRDRLESNGGS